MAKLLLRRVVDEKKRDEIITAQEGFVGTRKRG
jgi:hypothetical protein